MSNRTIYVPDSEWRIWQREARDQSSQRNETVSVSGLIRAAMRIALKQQVQGEATERRAAGVVVTRPFIPPVPKELQTRRRKTK